MNTDTLAIAGALKHNAGPVTLIVVELAALMAILCNVLFLVAGYAHITRLPTGVDEDNIAVLQKIGVIGATGGGSFDDTMHTLMSVPGVVAAAYGSPPFWVDRVPLFLRPGQRSPSGTAYEFFGSQGLDQALGVHLLAGHIPADTELPDAENLQPGLQLPILVTQAFAQHFFPGDTQVVGKVIQVTAPFVGVLPARITGIVDRLRGSLTGAPEDDDSFLLTVHLSRSHIGGAYVIRTRPGQAQAALHAAQQALARQDLGASVIAQSATVKDLRDQYLADTVANVLTLVTVLGVLSLIAVSGLTALTSFWVQRRRVHIGIRRALGATRGNIIHYFQVENALIVGVGIGLGAVLALALNTALMRAYAIPPLPLSYLAMAGVLLLLFGQLAALAPALRAAAIPPSAALRATY
jgi:putative ABC transport system permease protein